MRTIALYGTVAAIITAALVLFGTQGGPAFTTETYERIHRPQSQPDRQGPSVSHSQSHSGPPKPPWEFDYRRSGRNYGLSEDQCSVAFPELYKEVDRAVAYRRRVGNVTLEDLEVGWRGDGIVRAMIHNNQLYIIDPHGVWDHNHRPRALATLHALDRAISAAAEPLPDIEFTFTVHDSALMGPNDNHTTFAFSRLAHQETLWLMPDFGFWGWPDVGLRSYSELQTMLDDDEDDFLDKVPKLIWRGSLAVGSQDARAGLVEHSADQTWSDVQTLDWGNKTDIDDKLLTMEDHCGYMFTAQTEGNTYSGRLKYLLNCHSILLSHELRWIEHFHHLLQAGGKEQNYVKVKRDFSDLPKKMKNLLKPSNLLKAEVIADNARRVFREQYLTPAAEACYWRALIRGWASVQGFKPQVWGESELEDDWRGGKRSKKRMRGAPFESYAIMEQVEWNIPAKPRRVCIEE
ncbi:hypothetical protein LTR85_005106 [Meristemomyces frigidus]|nr:hypothetical protein LTR85_005106 [Meristemomyces frigidus]